MRGRVRLELATRDGRVIATRRAHNSVLRSGAELLGGLFSGKAGPITHMAVGNDDSPESDAFSTAELQTGGDDPLAGETVVALDAADFAVALDEPKRLVHVRVRGTLPSDAAIGSLREAGLVSRTPAGDKLYNRVTFSTLEKAGDHELTLFWEVSFPYGDLDNLF